MHVAPPHHSITWTSSSRESPVRSTRPSSMSSVLVLLPMVPGAGPDGFPTCATSPCSLGRLRTVLADVPPGAAANGLACALALLLCAPVREPCSRFLLTATRRSAFPAVVSCTGRPSSNAVMSASVRSVDALAPHPHPTSSFALRSAAAAAACAAYRQVDKLCMSTTITVKVV